MTPPQDEPDGDDQQSHAVPAGPTEAPSRAEPASGRRRRGAPRGADRRQRRASRRARLRWRWLADRVTRLLGLSPRIRRGGVLYLFPPVGTAGVPLSGDEQRLAVAARFPGGGGMVVHPTRERVFDDLGPFVARPWLRPLLAELRPGSRVLVLGCGTGAAAWAIARAVGPSGSVVALDRDAESIRFARRRYPASNVAFEPGGFETLAGELDGAFDAAVCQVDSPAARSAERETAEPPPIAAQESWRVVDEDGVLVLAARDGEMLRRLEPVLLAALAVGVSGELIQRASSAGGPAAALLVRRARKRAGG